MADKIKKEPQDTLLASIAVFAELCDSKKDIQSILSEFINASFALENKYSLSLEETTESLERHYEFDVPAAVVKTCLNQMKRAGVVALSDKKYSISNEKSTSSSLLKMLEEKRVVQNTIEDDLVSFCEETLAESQIVVERKELVSRFIACVIGRPTNDELGAVVSSYILTRSEDQDFAQTLNEMREGVVLVTGLKYSPDLNELGQWKHPLTIFLDTEILFNAAGFNGTVYKQLFDDFYSLVREINSAPRKKSGKDLIKLKFFEGVGAEIDRFFNAAEAIIRGETGASPESGAMEQILSGCRDVSDVIRKRADFESKLKNLRIHSFTEVDYLSRPDLNVEDSSLIEKYESIFGEGAVSEVLRSFTIINVLRNGLNRTSFEQCRFIILTGKYISFTLGGDLEVKFGDRDIPFCTDLNFITNRLWFKLNKGLSKDSKLPSSLDVVSNARISISAQLNRSVAAKFRRLKADRDDGQMTDEQAREYNHRLREKAKLPEEIVPESVKETIEFLYDEDDFHNYVQTSLNLKERSAELDEVKNELIVLRRKQKKEKRTNALIKTKREYSILTKLTYGLSVVLVFGLSLLVYLLISPADTVISIIGFLITLVVLGFSGYKWAKPRIVRNFRRWAHARYLRSIGNEYEQEEGTILSLKP